MSVRLRALALIMLVALAAAGATAWLTLRQASTQVRSSVAAGQQDTTRIADDLRSYGLGHATWVGVAPTVRQLTTRTGQRIRAVTDAGPVADSDLLAGQAARPVVGAPVLVDPRPVLVLPVDVDPTLLVRLTIAALQRYRSGAAYAACLTTAGVAVTATPQADGVPGYSPATPGTGGGCQLRAPADADVRGDSAAATACQSRSTADQRACLSNAFTARVTAVAPQVLRVYLGAPGESTVRLRTGPTVVVVVLVALAAILGALLLSRGVLRPVRALIGASTRLGGGDLSHRVPVSGRDEIAQLGRSFNRMADSLQASEERQRRMIGDIAHELRTPLANLRGYLEALRDGVVPPSPEVLASLHEEVLLQQRVVDDLQYLALAEAGRLTYHRTAVDLADLVTSGVTAHQAAAAQAEVELVAVAPAEVHAWADPDRLRQVIGNLVSNAVRATPAGGRVQVGAARIADSAVLTVTDTGGGISEADLPHLFDRFWRADSSRGRTTGGSGLGLAIARQIVIDHSGQIDVTSAVGRGTVFTVTLPST